MNLSQNLLSITEFLFIFDKDTQSIELENILNNIKKDNNYICLLVNDFFKLNSKERIRHILENNENIEFETIKELNLTGLFNNSYLENYQIFKEKFDQIINNITYNDNVWDTDKYENIIKKIHESLLILSNDLFLKDFKKPELNNILNNLSITSTEEIYKLTNFNELNQINNIEKYYDFLEYLSNLKINYLINSFNKNFTSDTEIIRCLCIITKFLIINTIMLGLLILLKGIFDSANFQYDKDKNSLELFNLNYDYNKIDLNDLFIFSSEDKNLEKLVDKAQRAKDKSENTKTDSSPNNNSKTPKASGLTDNENDSNDTSSSSEDTDENKDDTKPGIINKIKEKMQNVPAKTKTTTNKIRLFFQNKKNMLYFSRVRGKLPGLYQNYSSTAQIQENLMAGDPVVILKDKIAPNIIRIGKEMGKLAEDVQNLMLRASQAQSKEAVIEIANKWIGNKLPDLSKMGVKMEEVSLSKKIEYATRARMVNIIMKDREPIYGYTNESMIVRALPPANLFVVTYIVPNPHEQPQMQTVADIFKSHESFEIIATAESSDAFKINELMNAVIANKLDASSFEKMENNAKQTNLKMKELTRKAVQEGREEDEEVAKEYRLAMNGFKKSIETMAKQKIYIMELINTFGNMIIRINNLAKNCIKELEKVETAKTDFRFRKQMGDAKAQIITEAKYLDD